MRDKFWGEILSENALYSLCVSRILQAYKWKLP